MKEVVINKHVGYYGLSKEALKELYDRGSNAITVHTAEDYYGWRPDWKKRFENDKESGMLDFMGIYLTEDQKIVHANASIRDDAILVDVVKKLGSKANGYSAELKVVEIPDDVDFVIQGNDDGSEWIAEKHRTWL